MALVPIVQPPVIRLLHDQERAADPHAVHEHDSVRKTDEDSVPDLVTTVLAGHRRAAQSWRWSAF